MPEGIRCSRCGEHKPVDDFGWKRREIGRRDAYCVPCRQEYGRTYYRANRERRLAQVATQKRALRVERMQLLLDFLLEHPCTDCGETDPIGQHFTHRPWSAVLAEMQKCEVVCANCHRRRTFSRKGTVRLRLHEEAKRAAGIEPVSLTLEG